jgi:hypothetical protein
VTVRLYEWKTRDGVRRRIRLYKAWENLHNRVRGWTTDGAGRRRWLGLEVGFKNFKEFRAWALVNGYRKGLVLDRERPNEGYTPSNCRWITPEENARAAANQHKAKCKCFWCKGRRDRS